MDYFYKNGLSGHPVMPPDVPYRAMGRVAIENVAPSVDEGRFPAKCIAGDDIVVEADAFLDGHDRVRVVLVWGRDNAEPREQAMEPLVNDRWRAVVAVPEVGRYTFRVQAWPDGFRTWRYDLERRQKGNALEAVDLRVGAEIVRAAGERARQAGRGDDAKELARRADSLEDDAVPIASRAVDGRDPVLLALVDRNADRARAATSADFPLQADSPRARASAWYEMFPRSAGRPGEHGTLADVIDRLPYVAAMGFDTVYLPPVHPIGLTARKGFDHRPTAAPGDPGSPWAIGAREGGHTAVHPELGTVDDVERLVEAARANGIEVALDIAFQCSPDHPWVREHPQWFRHRPDQTIQYAENPPKKYQDIFPFDFGAEDREGLWNALRDVVLFWLERGVRTFRVDNPHTKPFPFWEWLISTVRAEHPDVVFLSEAFTRPKVMHRLAKLGFTHSYTYFAWRNTKWELETYLMEVTKPPVADFFRPHLWPNTPDILTEHLQVGGRPAFVSRLLLAATLGANYGIYGPAFELIETRPWRPGSEEYLESEKYGLRAWNLDRPDSLRNLIARVNRARREHPAFAYDRTLCFHPTDNPHLIAYSKRDPKGTDAVLVVVNLDPHHAHGGWIDVRMDALGLPPDAGFQAHDRLTDARYLFGPRNYVMLDPATLPAHIFAVRRHVRTEADFDYYL